MNNLMRWAGLPVTRWPNGAGRKADVRTGEGWMVGFAWLDADAPFSLLPGLDRTITLVDGPGFTLDVAGQAVPVRERCVPTRFDGGAVTSCRIDGASVVLNAMTQRARLRHRVALIDRSGPVAPGLGPASVAVVLEGAARLGEADLGRFDAAWVATETMLTLEAGSRVALVTIEPGEPGG